MIFWGLRCLWFMGCSERENMFNRVIYSGIIRIPMCSSRLIKSISSIPRTERIYWKPNHKYCAIIWFHCSKISKKRDYRRYRNPPNTNSNQQTTPSHQPLNNGNFQSKSYKKQTHICLNRSCQSYPTHLRLKIWRIVSICWHCLLKKMNILYWWTKLGILLRKIMWIRRCFWRDCSIRSLSVILSANDYFHYMCVLYNDRIYAIKSQAKTINQSSATTSLTPST